MDNESLKKELIKIEEAVKLNNLDVLEKLLNESHSISRKSEDILKGMLDQL